MHDNEVVDTANLHVTTHASPDFLYPELRSLFTTSPQGPLRLDPGAVGPVSPRPPVGPETVLDHISALGNITCRRICLPSFFTDSVKRGAKSLLIETARVKNVLFNPACKLALSDLCHLCVKREIP